MQPYQKDEINSWLCANIGQINKHEKVYKVHRYKNYAIILGDCSGIVIYQNAYNLQSFAFAHLFEDDGYYWVAEKITHGKSTSWLKDEIKCLQIAWLYLEKHATPLYYKGTKIKCGHQMPFINE